MQKRNQKGFTLIELLIVVAIIGLLATLAIVSLNTAREKANDTKRIADLKSMQTALELYWNGEGQGHYPGLDIDSSVATADVVDNWSQLETELITYLPALPRDPGANRYYYAALVDQVSTHYMLQSTLQDTGNSALNVNINTLAGTHDAVWATSDTTGTEANATSVTCNEASGQYCLLSVER